MFRLYLLGNWGKAWYDYLYLPPVFLTPHIGKLSFSLLSHISFIIYPHSRCLDTGFKVNMQRKEGYELLLGLF